MVKLLEFLSLPWKNFFLPITLAGIFIICFYFILKTFIKNFQPNHFVINTVQAFPPEDVMNEESAKSVEGKSILAIGGKYINWGMKRRAFEDELVMTLNVYDKDSLTIKDECIPLFSYMEKVKTNIVSKAPTVIHGFLVNPDDLVLVTVKDLDDNVILADIYGVAPVQPAVEPLEEPKENDVIE